MSVAKTVLAAALFAASFAGVAVARDQVITARLAAPAQHARVIAQNTLWTCEGDTCVANSRRGASVHDCRQFKREAGQTVTAFGDLSAEDLARCNGETTTEQARNG
ncbi:MAG TPA: hypothetical protein VG841_15475 [Caulobacterales bacterium]|nr:hypothetical protein [Caulobacterales bacterium]